MSSRKLMAALSVVVGSDGGRTTPTRRRDVLYDLIIPSFCVCVCVNVSSRKLWGSSERNQTRGLVGCDFFLSWQSEAYDVNLHVCVNVVGHSQNDSLAKGRKKVTSCYYYLDTHTHTRELRRLVGCEGQLRAG